MLVYQNKKQSLTKEQKESIGLLSFGTFLEYFDLMLYVHMAVLLNELFFPKYDPNNASLLAAFAFCSTFVFRPIGALLFGWMGDYYGRRSTVIFTTMMMAISCAIMTVLPTYAQLGVAAAWIVTICRIVQGISSLGEIIGAELYLTETIKPPKQYPAVAVIACISGLGASAALGAGVLITSFGFNWRYAFLAGTLIAVTGGYARTRLRETPDFVDAKRQLKDTFNKANLDISILKDDPVWREKVKWQTSLSYFLIQCSWPVVFYIAYIHCGSILKTSFGYTAEEIIKNNFIVSMFQVAGGLIFRCYLSSKIHPLNILKMLLVIFSLTMLAFPYIVTNLTNPLGILILQSIIVIFGLGDVPAVPIFFKHFPIFKRFTYSSFLYALSRALIYPVTSFGFIYLIKHFNDWGILIIIIPLLISYKFGVSHFEKLEKLEVINNAKKIM